MSSPPAPGSGAPRFLGLAATVLALLVAATGLHAYARLGGTPAIGSRWIQELMNLKARAAESLPANRLLVLGGSSALFGVLAESLAAQTGLPAANLSLHNNISPDVLFHWARHQARPGDTLLLALEYNYYTYQGIPDMQVVDYVLTLDPAYFRAMPGSDRLVFAAALGMDRLNGAARALLPRPARDPAEDNPLPRGQVAYQPYSFNRFGDQTWNQVPRHTRHLAHFFPVDFSRARLPSPGMDSIRQMILWCRAQGIRVVVTYPPFMRFPLHDQPRQRHFFQAIQAFYEAMGVPVLGRPDDFRYPKHWFFDTDYHLHLPAARVHSQTLGRLLRAHLQNPGAPPPAAPLAPHVPPGKLQGPGEPGGAAQR